MYFSRKRSCWLAGVGTSGQVLTSTGGGAPTWATPITSGTAWQLSGNTGTTPGTGGGQNYIGTTDSKDFVVATAATERMRVTSSGSVGINTPIPNSTLQLNGSMSVVVNTITPVRLLIQQLQVIILLKVIAILVLLL